MNSTDLAAVVAECTAHLRSALDADWVADIPGMEWTPAKAVAHIAEGLLWYSTDFAAGPRELSTMQMGVAPEKSPEELVATVEAFGTVLVRVLEGAAEGARGWHPMGMADASGFAAMGCDELLVHTWDAAEGLRRPFTPSAGPAERTLRRLFPWAPDDHDSWTTLLWANGRADLPCRPRQVNWRWHCAPLSERDS